MTKQEKLINDLKLRVKLVQEQIKRLEELKKVSPATMQIVINI
jgi:hypothetical protein